MEISQGNSLCSYLYLKQAKKNSLFFSSFLQNQRTGVWNRSYSRVGGVGTSGKGEVAGKRGRKVNTVQKCVHIYVNAKMIPIETIPAMGAEG
jgi:hypothetical protein